MSEPDPKIAGPAVHGPVYPRILVADDDPDQVELQSELLRAHFPQSTITWAPSCTEARGMDLSQFDVGIFDLQLPDGNGIELLKSVRATHDLPVIIVTGDRSGSSAADAVRNGAVDFVVKHGDYLRVVPIVVEKALAMIEIKRVNRRLEKELRLRNAELERLNVQLREMAARDSLTGLYNRRHFGELLVQLYAEARRYNTDLTCMMMDLDNFKRVNDALGHQTGDRLLQLTSRVIRESIRESDVAVRYGGDEFVVVLPRTMPSEAQSLAKRILIRFRQELLTMLPEASIATLSIGLASREQDQPPSADALVSLADEALYLAKAGGKDRIMVVRPVAVEH
jgi:diguanylate cyclase (GGDEF)-like protein